MTQADVTEQPAGHPGEEPHRAPRPDPLADLNPVQKEAVVAPPGPMLVIAGAGSGKTRVLTHRVAHLISAERVSPFSILAITFTNKAAAEMKDRVATLVGPVAHKMWVSTFHSACARILRREAPLLGYRPSFSIYDQSDAVRLADYVRRDLGLDPKRFAPRQLQARISALKNELVTAEQFAARAVSPPEKRLADVYTEYQRRLAEASAVDFDDLLVLVVRLFREHPDALARWRARFSHVLVDEFQDTNAAQWEIVRLLSAEHRNVMVVGDADQAIYRFRGADHRNLVRFEEAFPEATVIVLEQNYRSSQNILDAANAVITNNVSRRVKHLWTEQVGGELLGGHQLVLQGRDAALELPGREPLGVEAEVAAHVVGEAHGVGLVVDAERRPVAEERRLPAQDPGAGRVEGGDPHLLRHRADEGGDPLLHLGRGLVGEGDGQDRERRHPLGRDQVRDPVGEDPGLARPGAGDHEHRPRRGDHRLLLDRVQPLEGIGAVAGGPVGVGGGRRGWTGVAGRTGGTRGRAGVRVDEVVGGGARRHAAPIVPAPTDTLRTHVRWPRRPTAGPVVVTLGTPGRRRSTTPVWLRAGCPTRTAHPTRHATTDHIRCGHGPDGGDPGPGTGRVRRRRGGEDPGTGAGQEASSVTSTAESCISAVESPPASSDTVSNQASRRRVPDSLSTTVNEPRSESTSSRWYGSQAWSGTGSKSATPFGIRRKRILSVSKCQTLCWETIRSIALGSVCSRLRSIGRRTISAPGTGPARWWRSPGDAVAQAPCPRGVTRIS